MHTFITGVILISIGLANVVASRRQPRSNSAGVLGIFGWVGLACGAVLSILGAIEILRAHP
jgi:hypothetical protein